MDTKQDGKGKGKHKDTSWVATHLLRWAMLALLLTMACATFVFMSKGCSSNSQDAYKADADSITCNVNFAAMDSVAVHALKKDSVIIVPITELNNFISATDSLIAACNSRLDNRIDNLVGDIRQETNNNLDKTSAWLAFWITILGVVGVVCPIAYQWLNSEQFKEKIKETKDELQNLKEEIRETSEAYSLKMETMSYDIISRDKISEIGPGVKSLYICSVKKHLNELTQCISTKTNDNLQLGHQDFKVLVFSVLVNLDAFLQRLSVDCSYDQHKNITNVKDTIKSALTALVDASKPEEMKPYLQKICSQLAMIS